VANFDHILQRKMTRKEFLITLGLALLSLIGISALIEMLGKNQPKKGFAELSAGFGFGTYGGNLGKVKVKKDPFSRY